MISVGESKLALLEKEINDLKTRLSKLESTNQELVLRIERIQSFQNRKKVLINGLPKSAALEADPVKAVQDLINDDLDISVSSPDISQCFLLKNSAATNHAQIQVNFKNLDLKQRVIKAFIQRMRNGNCIMRNGSRVYFNNKLTATQYKNFCICKRMRKAGKISIVYNRGDAVFVRVSPDSSPIHVRTYKCVEDLAKRIGFSIDESRAKGGNRNTTRSASSQKASSTKQQASSSSTTARSSPRDPGVTTRKNAKNKIHN